ncbi:MAG: hypothetical protein AAFW97_10440 [Pseudomonadota bacterium]
MATPAQTSIDAPLWTALFGGAISVALLIRVAPLLPRRAGGAAISKPRRVFVNTTRTVVFR